MQVNVQLKDFHPSRKLCLDTFELLKLGDTVLCKSLEPSLLFSSNLTSQEPDFIVIF